MKAHKVSATYYSSWNIKDTKHSFYVFINHIQMKRGVEKAIAKLIRLHKKADVWYEYKRFNWRNNRI